MWTSESLSFSSVFSLIYAAISNFLLPLASTCCDRIAPNQREKQDEWTHRIFCSRAYKALIYFSYGQPSTWAKRQTLTWHRVMFFPLVNPSGKGSGKPALQMVSACNERGEPHRTKVAMPNCTITIGTADKVWTKLNAGHARWTTQLM